MRTTERKRNLTVLGKWLSGLNIVPYIWPFAVYKYLLLY